MVTIILTIIIMIISRMIEIRITRSQQNNNNHNNLNINIYKNFIARSKTHRVDISAEGNLTTRPLVQPLLFESTIEEHGQLYVVALHCLDKHRQKLHHAIPLAAAHPV